MAERICARDLLADACTVYDDPRTELAQRARSAWTSGFHSGGEWMRDVFAYLRGAPPAGPSDTFQYLGVVKYGLASVGAMMCGYLAWQLEQAWILVLVIPVFYAIEAQMVFLFPLVLDGSTTPFADARRWTVHAGGTLAVMRVVLPIAVTMLFGGFVGRGFVRSWCLGCLVVCLWYERLRIRIENAQAIEGPRVP